MKIVRLPTGGRRSACARLLVRSGAISILVTAVVMTSGTVSATPRPSLATPSGTTESLNSSYYHWWCSSERTPTPSFNLSTGNGTWSGAARAHACPGAQGSGASDDSYAWDE